MTSSPETTHSALAVWYFVGATFVFGVPAAFFPDPPAWVRIAFLFIGVVLVVAGGIQLGRELHEQRASRPSAR